jgi:large subunit ribosomal protein L10
MPNTKKQEIVSDLSEIVARSKGQILTEYRGLTVADVSKLRKRLRESNAEYHIVKNTLYKIALGGEISPELEALLTGPTAIVFANDDVVAPAKSMLDFVREMRKPDDIKVKGGYIDGKVFNLEQVQALSKLPPKLELIAQLIGTLNAPASELVGTLNGVISELIGTVDALVEKQGGAAVAA